MPNHFLHIADFSKDELLALLQLAKEIKTKYKKRDNKDITQFKKTSVSEALKKIV